jgi:hypothetical protein
MQVSLLYDQALENMERSVHHLCALVPAPRHVPYRDSFVFRYVEQSLNQALVQKLVRLTSGLHATRLLMEAGFVQEQGSLQRMLDELQEDITFLSFSVINNDSTPLHQAYLDAFYQEEFLPVASRTTSVDRPMIPRKKIRAYIDRALSGQKGSSQSLEAARTINKTYSGYLHAASPQIMDLFGGSPARFHLRGMRGTPRHHEHRADLWNYFHRAIIAFGFAAKAFGEEELFTSIKNFSDRFAKATGSGYQSREWEET